MKIDATEEDAVLHTLGLAAGQINATAYTQWLKASCVRP